MTLRLDVVQLHVHSFESGGAPVTSNVRTATLAGGIAQLQYDNLAIGA